MKKLLLILGAVVLVAGGLVAPAFAQDEGEVTVTAEPAEVSITVTPDAVSYGLVAINATDLLLVEPEPDLNILVLHTGNCWMSFDIRGVNTDGGWILGTSPDVDTYVHYFGYPGPTPNWLPLATGNRDLGATSYAPGSNQAFKLKMDTPTETTILGPQATAVTVVAIMEVKGISANLVTDAGSYPEGTSTATLTVTVTDENDLPLTGLASGAFFTMISPAGPSFSFETVIPLPTFTETNPNVSGIYEATLDISGLAQGGYRVLVDVTDTSNRKATDRADFDITAPAP